MRLPSIIAGTLAIPALYLLGRELYDRRTGLVAAAFGAASPLLIWYSQEARMYAFVELFGLLAAVDAAAGDPQPEHGQLGGLHPGDGRAALVPLLRPAADRRAAADLDRRPDPPAPHRRADPGDQPRLRLLRWRCWRCSSCRCSCSRTSSSTRPAPRSARRAGRTTRSPSTPSSPTWPGRSGATTRTPRPSCSPRAGRCSCCCRCCCSAAAARGRRSSSRSPRSPRS